MRSTDLAITFFTFLTVLADAAVVGVVATAVAGRRWPRPWQALRAELAAGGVGLAWVVAAVCTSGSLYFSEVAGFEPCRLCWIQRGFMYPLVLVLGGALLAARAGRDRLAGGARLLAGTAALLGAGVSTYHVLLERFPSLETSASCDPKVPCSLVWFERLGVVTLPFMALSGFVLVLTLLVASRPVAAPSVADPASDPTSDPTPVPAASSRRLQPQEVPS
ncbi:MAG TPA: disulfide bond formation protein B [Acidimicrobiales bacterium]